MRNMGNGKERGKRGGGTPVREPTDAEPTRALGVRKPLKSADTADTTLTAPVWLPGRESRGSAGSWSTAYRSRMLSCTVEAR